MALLFHDFRNSHNPQPPSVATLVFICKLHRSLKLLADHHSHLDS